MNEDGYLMEIHERTQIEKRDSYAAYTEDGGQTWTKDSRGSTVSMNMWGFYPTSFASWTALLRHFLKKILNQIH